MTDPKMISKKVFKSTTTSAAYPVVPLLTLGLIKVYSLSMEDGRVYLADLGYNESSIYDVASAGHNQKYFWKLNIGENPPPKVEWIEKEFAVEIQLNEIPTFDAQYGGKGGWITVDYTVMVTVAVDRETAIMLHQQVNVLQSVEQAALDAARAVLPMASYESAITAQLKDQISGHVMRNKLVQKSGLAVVDVAIKGVKGSSALSNSLRDSFQRILTAKDEVEVANVWQEVDEDVFTKYLSKMAPEEALKLRGRSADRMVEAMMLSGMKPEQIVARAGQGAKNSADEMYIANDTARAAFEQVESWPPLTPPSVADGFEARLKWEHDVLEDRIPHMLSQREHDPQVFEIQMDNGKDLKITWLAAEDVPEVELGGFVVSVSKYPFLQQHLFEADNTTVWQIFERTRKLLSQEEAK